MNAVASTLRRDQSRRRLRAAAITFAALIPLSLSLVVAQGPAQSGPTYWADELITREGYVEPPRELAEAVLAPRHLNVTLSELSPDQQWFLREVGDGPVPLARLSKSFHDLGGEFIDYGANRDRALTVRSNATIEVISAADGSKKMVATPPGVRISGAEWSPDGTSVLYLGHTDTATHIWATDLATNRARQITTTPLLATMVTGFSMSDSGTLAAVLVPANRSPMPMAPSMPAGPDVKVSVPGDENRLRTYASLMSSPYEHDLLEWHATGQLALIDLATGRTTTVGQPTMFRGIDLAPNGHHLRVTRMTRPFSYIVPAGNAGQVEEVWDTSGQVLTEISSRELNEGVRDDDDPPAGRGGRGGANQTGKRELRWHPMADGFTYLEQEPAPETSDDDPPPPTTGRGARGGRGGGAQRPDRLMHWMPPFSDTSTELVYESRARMSGHRFSDDMKVLFFNQSQGQNSTTYAVYLDEPGERHEIAQSRGDDIYTNPGSLMSANGGVAGGRGGGRGGGGGSAPVLLSGDRSSVFLGGTLYDRNPDQVGPKTFIDQVDIRTGEKSRVWESNNNGIFERVSTVLDIDAKKLIISRESPTDVRQQFLIDGATVRQLTNNEDIAPDLTTAPRQRFTVTRPDGFEFRVTVTLPPGYQAGTRLPAMFWFYPREYTDQETYDRPAQTFNKNAVMQFNTRSMHYLTRLGYAVVEPDSPIVGEQGAMNDNYERDLRNNLAAVIDELDRRALIDRTRLGIGGHSYGAFSTVNAMVHTPFFKAGIAGDGNYNRTLTPLGFQSERRIFWQAPNVYLDMSPFFQADNLTGALLMYHGAHDQNVGTAPINSVRLYHALNGLGKTVSLYMYPYEDHGPVARETQLDLWARWAAWLDKYVKNPENAERPATQAGAAGGRR